MIRWNNFNKEKKKVIIQTIKLKNIVIFFCRSERGHREKEWTDFDEVFVIAFDGGKILMYRNQVNRINGRRTKRLSARPHVLSMLRYNFNFIITR